MATYRKRRAPARRPGPGRSMVLDGPAPAPTVSEGRGPIENDRAFDDEWRRWIAENLLVDNSPESILEVLQANGFPAAESAAEIQAAQQSPYLRGAEILRSRVRKRDWLMAIHRKLNRLRPAAGEVERKHRPSRQQFFEEHYATNRPVIITGMMDDWPALKTWGLEYFAERFGDREVEVQMDRDSGAKGAEYEVNSDRFIGRMTFGAFLKKLQTAGQTNDFYLTANNSSSNRKALPELWDDIVQVPEYLDPDAPGGFLWMGPAGTVTPFHHDLTNNFMAQVMGRKLLKLVPSWDVPLMQNYYHCFSRIDGRTRPPAPRPEFDEPQILECVLHPGEILFLPIGCMHFVQGLDITLTISFTNFIFDNDFSSFYSCYCPV